MHSAKNNKEINNKMNKNCLGLLTKHINFHILLIYRGDAETRNYVRFDFYPVMNSEPRIHTNVHE